MIAENTTTKSQPAAEARQETAPLSEAQVEFIRATASTGRDATIKVIREALKRRSGKVWSVAGGRGTAWGWITIEAPPARRIEFGYTSPAECQELGELLGKGRPVHQQGESVPASSAYYRVALCCALFGHPGPFTAEQYWD